MVKLSKKSVKVQRAEWAEAVMDGRVVRILDGLTLKSFPTHAARDLALAEYAAADIPCEIVDPMAALISYAAGR